MLAAVGDINTGTLWGAQKLVQFQIVNPNVYYCMAGPALVRNITYLLCYKSKKIDTALCAKK